MQSPHQTNTKLESHPHTSANTSTAQQHQPHLDSRNQQCNGVDVWLRWIEQQQLDANTRLRAYIIERPSTGAGEM